MKKIIVIGFEEKTAIFSFIKEIKKLCEHINIQADFHIYDKKDLSYYDTLQKKAKLDDYVAAISVGGDGTFIYTSRIFAGTNIPILGVNLSTLGFNTRIEPKDFGFYLKQLLNDELEYEQRDMLEVYIPKTKDTFLVVNDGVVSHTGISRMIRLKVSLDEKPVYNFYGDGIIFSTATGSTAYNLSAGGPILHPSVNAMVISPICPHVLAIRPYILPLGEKLVVEVLESSAQAQITLDGQKTIMLEPGDIIHFTHSKKKNTIIKTNTSFTGILKEKLGWHI